MTKAAFPSGDLRERMLGRKELPMHIGRTLAVSAALGFLAGCGGETPPAQSPQAETTSTTGAKASCGGADHTDKGHCGAQTPSAASSASATPATPPAAPAK